MGTGSVLFHLRTPGSPSSPPMPAVWHVTLNVETKNVDFMTRANCPMVDPKVTENDVTLTMTSDTTPMTLALAPNKSPPDSPSGQFATSETARDKRTTNIKLTEWTDGTTDSANSSAAIENFNYHLILLSTLSRI